MIDKLKRIGYNKGTKSIKGNTPKELEMKIKAKSDFWTGGRNGRYKIPTEFKEADKIMFDFEEVAKFAEENKRVKYIYVAFETEEEEQIYNERKAAYLKAEAERREREYRAFLERRIDSLPKEAATEVRSWKTISRSPYSDSFYNSKNISWTSKPEGSLRLSDHWNFESYGEIHCKLDTTDEYISGVWILARYENGIYHEIKRF